MPLYEYRCEACGEEFEKIVRFSEADITQSCPTCASRKTTKKISAAAAIGGLSTGSGGSSSAFSSGGICGSGGRFT